MSTVAAPIPREVRDAVFDLLAEYGLAIDQDRLDDWTALFTEDCDYRVISRENEEQGLPNVMIWCDNRDMLLDRVDSYRHVNEYNLHWDRHVIGLPRIQVRDDSTWHIQASYSLFQTDLEGVSLIAAYRDEFNGLVSSAGVDGLISALQKKNGS